MMRCHPAALTQNIRCQILGLRSINKTSCPPPKEHRTPRTWAAPHQANWKSEKNAAITQKHNMPFLRPFTESMNS
jgi:hypothetical protein